jgi:hypothetical protein
MRDVRVLRHPHGEHGRACPRRRVPSHHPSSARNATRSPESSPQPRHGCARAGFEPWAESRCGEENNPSSKEPGRHLLMGVSRETSAQVTRRSPQKKNRHVSRETYGLVGQSGLTLLRFGFLLPHPGHQVAILRLVGVESLLGFRRGKIKEPASIGLIR